MGRRTRCWRRCSKVDENNGRVDVFNLGRRELRGITFELLHDDREEDGLFDFLEDPFVLGARRNDAQLKVHIDCTFE